MLNSVFMKSPYGMRGLPQLFPLSSRSLLSVCTICENRILQMSILCVNVNSFHFTNVELAACLPIHFQALAVTCHTVGNVLYMDPGKPATLGFPSV